MAGRLSSLLEFFYRCSPTGRGSNDVGYSNAERRRGAAAAEAAPTMRDRKPRQRRSANPVDDMPVVPLWDNIRRGGWSTQIKGVTVTWNGLADYENIVKA